MALSNQQNPVRGFLASVGLDPEILVEFQFKLNPAACVQQVFDITDPANRVLIGGQGGEAKAG